MNNNETTARQIVFLCELNITPQKKIEAIKEMIENTIRDSKETVEAVKMIREKTPIKVRKQKKGNLTGIRIKAIHKICKTLRIKYPNWSYRKAFRHAILRYDEK